MNSNPHNPGNGECGEETLRLIASLPAPEGLEERVHQSLRAAPRQGRVLTWPAGMRARVSFRSNSFRTAAAAAIVFVVVGGGWGVYSRVQTGQSGKVVVMPAPLTNGGGFSGAGAIRTPETLPGPKVREQENKGAREQENKLAAKPLEPQKTQGTVPAPSRSIGKHPANPLTMQPVVAK